MRTRVVPLALTIVALAAAGLAQNQRGAGRNAARADGGAAADAAATDAASAPSPSRDAGGAAGAADAGRAGRGARDAGAAAVTDAGGGAALSAAPTRTFDLTMQQRGTGAITHFAIPEQLARNDVPVFVQVRSSAPIDHVSLFYRGQGATRYTEVRMQRMGDQQGLPDGYGAQIDCRDAFPPHVEYYVQAIDTSGAPVGSAGSAGQPIQLPIVRQRSVNIVPTLPGQEPPRNCGSLTGPGVVAVGRDGGVRRGTDAGPAVEERGTADLGEPCARDNDCRRGLRCGSTRTCVFVNPQ